MPVVVADSSPLVYLARLGHFDLLRTLHGEIVIPTAVWQEVAVDGAHLMEGRSLAAARKADWAKVEPVTLADLAAFPVLAELDDGEGEAIALAVRLNALLIIDEREGREVATRLGLRLTGTLGLLIEAKNQGLIESLGTEINRLMETTNFRCSAGLLNDALREAGE